MLRHELSGRSARFVDCPASRTPIGHRLSRTASVFGGLDAYLLRRLGGKSGSSMDAAGAAYAAGNRSTSRSLQNGT